MGSWFDIQRLPLDLREPENPQDLEASVSDVHRMLQELQSKGLSSDRVVLGGFSQGGTVSLLAGLSYHSRLAGIISISGWCANRQDVASWISPAARETPVLMCCGDGDPLVDFRLTKASSELLKKELADKLEALSPKRGIHQPLQEELQAVTMFMVNLFCWRGSCWHCSWLLSLLPPLPLP